MKEGRKKGGGIRMCRGRHIGERSKEDDVCMCMCVYASCNGSYLDLVLTLDVCVPA